MDKFLEIVRTAVYEGATDIHLVENLHPLYRINKELKPNINVEPMNKYDLEGLMEALVDDSLELVELFEEKKRLDLPFELDQETRLRINASMAAGVPTFSIRIIRNKAIDIEKLRLRSIIEQLKGIHSGLVLITGKVNTGKTTTLNAFVQEVNKVLNKKIVMLEEPIEYRHTSKKAIIVQKEVSTSADVPNYYDGVINLLREDSDIAIIGEIRDRKTMDAVLDLAESGGLVIGTLHTRSCGETIDRILGMYDPNEQKAIKYALSNVLKLVVSQKLVRAKSGATVLVPETMLVNSTIAALIRQEKFSVSEIQDAIHHSKNVGTISFERSFTNLYNDNIIDITAIKNNVEENSFKIITDLIGGGY